MAIQLSILTRNARLDAIETLIGTTPVLKIWTGAAPTNCASTNSGTCLATLTLPSDWMAAAASGAKAIAGTWQDASADAAGTADHFRIYESTAVTCHIQGTVGVTAEDLVLDNDVIAAGQQVTVTGFTLTDANS